MYSERAHLRAASAGEYPYFIISSAKALGANASPNDKVTAERIMAARLIMLQNLLEDIFQLATVVAL
jgi:hypothetical protein